MDKNINMIAKICRNSNYTGVLKKNIDTYALRININMSTMLAKNT